MHRLFPADELAEIRAEIARLKLREAQLRDRLMKSPLATLTGRFHRAEVSHAKSLVFDPSLLPDDIRNDPAYWCERSQTVVHTLPLAAKAPPPRPGWPIHRAPNITPGLKPGLTPHPAH